MTERITAVTGYRRWDSRARPTVEVEIRVGELSARALAPAGASTGSGEALDLRDGGTSFGGLDVREALSRVDSHVAPALIGLDVRDQEAVDDALAQADGTDGFTLIGGNVAVAASAAAARAAAALQASTLWAYLDPAATLLPLPEVQLFGGGAHAGGRIDVQDILIVPVGARCFAEAIDWAARIYAAGGQWLAERGRRVGVADEGGWWPEFDSNEQALAAATDAISRAGLRAPEQVGIAIDVAATGLWHEGRYRLRGDGVDHDPTQWLTVLLGWLDRYPVISLEDPFAEHDEAGMRALTAAAGQRVQIVGDDFLVTDPVRVDHAATVRSVNSVLIKPNQAGTLTRARRAAQVAAEHGFGVIVSGRSGETEESWITHLAVGWHAGGFKVGSMARGERTAKWNELLRIEDELGPRARFAGAAGLGDWRSG